MSKYYSSSFEMFSMIFASVSVDLEEFRSDNIFPTSYSGHKAMDNIQKMIEARNLKHQMKKAKNKKTGIALAAARKQVKHIPVVQKVKVDKFLMKGEAKSLPSKVPKPDIDRSPLKLSRSTRNLKKCGYTSKGEGYAHSTDTYNPFDCYAIQNLGTLQSLLNICCAHVRECGCKGSLKFISPESNKIPKHFSSTLFSVHTLQCSECSTKFELESDFLKKSQTKQMQLLVFQGFRKLLALQART